MKLLSKLAAVNTRTGSPKQHKHKMELPRTVEYLNNERTLIQLCHNLEWRSVEKCCILLIKILQDQESYPPDLVEKCKVQLQSADPWGNLPLHLLCYLKPPVDVLELLLEAIRLSGLPLATASSDRGASPLLIACSSRASQKFIKTLLEHTTSTITTSDKLGQSPISNLVRGYHSFADYPIANESFVPLDDVTMSHIEEARAHAKNQIDAWQQCEFEETSFRQFWATVEDLVLAAWAQRFPKLPFVSMLHGAALIADTLPTSLSDLILRVFQDQIQSDDSLHPLHLALAAAKGSGEGDYAHHAIRCQQLGYFMERLLELDPAAASKPLPSLLFPTERRSAFAQAVSSGMAWHLSVEGIIVQPLQKWHAQDPDSLQEQDKGTGLYPFQLAAAAKIPAKSVTTSMERAQVDTIYNLLRNSPNVL